MLYNGESMNKDQNNQFKTKASALPISLVGVHAVSGLSLEHIMYKYNYKTVRVNGACCRKHRVIMENHVGRKLKRFEVVHHKDGNIHNNAINNLELMSISNHSRLHSLKLWQTKEFRDKRHERINAVLTPDTVRLIRKLLQYNYLRQCDIAEIFGVVRQTIQKIKYHENWSNIK